LPRPSCRDERVNKAERAIKAYGFSAQPASDTDPSMPSMRIRLSNSSRIGPFPRIISRQGRASCTRRKASISVRKSFCRPSRPVPVHPPDPGPAVEASPCLRPRRRSERAARADRQQDPNRLDHRELARCAAKRRHHGGRDHRAEPVAAQVRGLLAVGDWRLPHNAGRQQG